MAQINIDTADIAVGRPQTPYPIANAFQEIEDFINNALVGDDNLTSPNNSVWRTVSEVTARTSTATFSVAGTFVFSGVDGQFGVNAGTVFPKLWKPTAADVAVAGKTAQVRLEVDYGVNGVAPAASFTVGLHRVTQLSGSGSAVMTTTVTSASIAATAITTPSAGAADRVTSPAVTLSGLTAGEYAFCVVTSAAIAANSALVFTARLQMRHS